MSLQQMETVVRKIKENDWNLIRLIDACLDRGAAAISKDVGIRRKRLEFTSTEDSNILYGAIFRSLNASGVVRLNNCPVTFTLKLTEHESLTQRTGEPPDFYSEASLAFKFPAMPDGAFDTEFHLRIWRKPLGYSWRVGCIPLHLEKQRDLRLHIAWADAP